MHFDEEIVVENTKQLCINQLQAHLVDLAYCEDENAMFELLTFMLQGIILFDECIVLDKHKKGHYETIATTNVDFEDELWPQCQLFKKALEENYVICEGSNIELKSDKKTKIKNALLIGVRSKVGEGLFIFTNITASNMDNFTYSVNIKVFLQQVYFNLINMVCLKKQTKKLRSLANKFTNLTLLFKEMGTEWFWRTDSSMFFINVHNVETVGNIYTEVFLKHKIEQLITVAEKNKENKWMLFNQVISNHEAFYNFECEISSPEECWISFSGKPQFDDTGRFIGYLGLAKNITLSKEKESALKAEKQKAIEASKAKSNFLSVVSHEIRTPINAVIGMIELLLDTDLTTEQRQWVDYASSSTEILYGLVTDVLDFSKIESGTVAILSNPFNLKILIENIVGQLSIIKNSEDIIFRTLVDDALPEFVIGDEYRLGQVLFNLLGNAFQFTYCGSITLDIKIEGDQIVIEVKDTGIGIAKKNIDMIFKPFSQVNDSINRETEGVGLGLSISKNLVELMGGKIVVDTQLGLGSSFKIYVPLKRAQISDVRKKPSKQQVSLSILVAEDNKTNQVLIKAYLEKLNHKVTIASDGSEAITLFKCKKFDLVLMDVMMPIMDGLSAAEHIRDKLMSDVPIYALTANAEKNNKVSCFKVGMNKVLTKPIKFEVLKNTLHGLYPRALSRDD